MRICITAKDIKVGKRISPNCCPVARALSRALRKPVRVGVYNYLVDRNWYDLPEKIQSWIEKFDIGNDVKPTWFNI